MLQTVDGGVVTEPGKTASNKGTTARIVDLKGLLMSLLSQALTSALICAGPLPSAPFTIGVISPPSVAIATHTSTP
jgi:hypothetical protein